MPSSSGKQGSRRQRTCGPHHSAVLEPHGLCGHAKGGAQVATHHRHHLWVLNRTCRLAAVAAVAAAVLRRRPRRARLLRRALLVFVVRHQRLQGLGISWPRRRRRPGARVGARQQLQAAQRVFLAQVQPLVLQDGNEGTFRGAIQCGHTRQRAAACRRPHACRHSARPLHTPAGPARTAPSMRFRRSTRQAPDPRPSLHPAPTSRSRSYSTRCVRVSADHSRTWASSLAVGGEVVMERGGGWGGSLRAWAGCSCTVHLKVQPGEGR